MILYDNELGKSEGERPTTPLGGGSIVLHKKWVGWVPDYHSGGAGILGAAGA